MPLYIMANSAGLVRQSARCDHRVWSRAFGVFWMTQYITDALPYELIEAARVDGCSTVPHLHLVGVPATRPAASMLFLFTFIGQWTNYFSKPMLVLGANKATCHHRGCVKGAHFTDYTIVMSGVILTAAPLLLLFFVAGKPVVAGIIAGGEGLILSFDVLKFHALLGTQRTGHAGRSVSTFHNS